MHNTQLNNEGVLTPESIGAVCLLPFIKIEPFSIQRTNGVRVID